MTDTRPIRKGEELDKAKLADYLCNNLLESNEAIEVSQFPAGASNLTYCIKIGENEYVLRRPPFGNKVKSAHDMSREFKVLSKLSKIYSPAPKPLIYCQNDTVIGSEFYLMERRKGLIIRGKSPTADLQERGGQKDYRAIRLRILQICEKKSANHSLKI